jgi:hypothetical protein
MPHPPSVVNMSYGVPGECPDELRTSVERALQRGIILVAGAGNTNDFGNEAIYPADCPGVIAVGAVDVNAKAWTGSERQDYVALAGPGVHMVGYDTTASSGYGYADGTSDASAIVSGVFADVRAHFPAMSARDVVARVLYTARQFQGAPHTRNNAYGYGVARPYNALTDTVPASAPNPIYDAVGSPSASSAPESSSPTVPGSSGGAGGTHAVSQPGAAGSGGSSSGAPVGLIVGIVAAVVVVLAAVALLVRRRRPAHGAAPAPPWPPRS